MMFQFAALVYLTGNNGRTMWLYIIFGLIALNILNIIRLAVLFITVQKYEIVESGFDHHDLYNIIIYIIIKK